LEILLEAVKPQQARADSYSRSNDRDAIEFLLRSLDESLLCTLISLIPKEKQSFVSLWFVLVDLNQKHTVAYLDTVKAEIRAIVPGNFPGENISEFVTAVLSKFVVLENAMAVDHDLTTAVILNLLKAGGPTTTENSGRQLFAGEIADFSKKHARALPGIHHLSLANKDAKMKELRLTLQDLCTLATEEYSQRIGSNSWELAGRVSDTRTVPARYASASANVLEQNIPAAPPRRRLRVPRASTAASPVTTLVTAPRRAALVDPAAVCPMVAGGRGKADTTVAVEVRAAATAEGKAVDAVMDVIAEAIRTGVEFLPVLDSPRTSLSKARATIGVSIASVGRRLMDRPGTPGPSHARLTSVSPATLVLGSPSVRRPLLASASASSSLASSRSSSSRRHSLQEGPAYRRRWCRHPLPWSRRGEHPGCRGCSGGHGRTPSAREEAAEA
jgi:hypothetical protein